MKQKYKVIIPQNPIFFKHEDEIKKLYEICQKSIGDENNFDFVKNNTLFYLFLYKDTVLGGIYYYKINDKLFLNAFAKRGFLNEKLECLQLSLSWFNCDIFAVAKNKASILCLLRCGFFKDTGDIYRFKHNVHS